MHTQNFLIRKLTHIFVHILAASAVLLFAIGAHADNSFIHSDHDHCRQMHELFKKCYLASHGGTEEERKLVMKAIAKVENNARSEIARKTCEQGYKSNRYEFSKLRPYKKFRKEAIKVGACSSKQP